MKMLDPVMNYFLSKVLEMNQYSGKIRFSFGMSAGKVSTFSLHVSE
jgi:hypothetical protein